MFNAMKKLVFSLFLSPILFLASCSNGTLYTQEHELNPEGWSKTEVLEYEANLQKTDSACSIVLNVRHDATFGSQNLWLFTAIETPSGEVTRDTIECLLADNLGEWLGSGWGSLREIHVILSPKFMVKETGVYKFYVRHGMRQEPLQGVSDVGIEIFDKPMTTGAR